MTVVLPDEVLREIFCFSTFRDLEGVLSVSALLKVLGIKIRQARWVCHDKEYIPFQWKSTAIHRSTLQVHGLVYRWACRGWQFDKKTFSCPWDLKTMFRNEATQDMVPRILCSHEKQYLDITYRGRRNSPRTWTFEEGKEVDVMDLQGNWWKGSMVSSKDDLILYHFHGWESRWDQWYPKDSLHVAPLYSITRDWRSKLGVHDWVDVKIGSAWFEGVICAMTPTHFTVQYFLYERRSDWEMVDIEISSERIMYHGAHSFIYFWHSLVKLNNAVWNDGKGTEIYQYRITKSRNSTTILLDHILSEKEECELLTTYA